MVDTPLVPCMDGYELMVSVGDLRSRCREVVE